MNEPKALKFGPLRSEWKTENPKGDCKNCGGDCDGEDCGLHAAGCIYGGWDAYWLYDENCPRFHGV